MPKFEKPRAPEEIAVEIGEAHSAKGKLEKLRKEFFDYIRDQKKATKLARRSVRVDKEKYELAAAEERAVKLNPGYRRITTVERDDHWKILLEQDPNFLGDSYITGSKDEPGVVVTKTIRSGSSLVELDRLKQDDPDLYEQVTFIPPVDRQPKNPDELTEEQLAKLQPYLYEGAPTAALNVRKAKPEDYEDAQA
jgi:hypothetical protein